MIIIQAQSVVYNNNKSSLELTIESIDNAVRVARDYYKLDVKLELHYGDAGELRTFTEEDLCRLNNQYKNISIMYKFFGENTGSARGHNILSEGCKSDYILIMNPDVKLSPHFFFYILEPFKETNVGMVEARQTPIEHQKQYDIVTLQTEWATTACAIIRKDLFERLNGFDSDSFFLYCDDVDFSWRLRLLGYVIIYQPLAPVYHPKKLDKQGRWIPTKAEIYYSAESSLLMAYKWSNGERLKYLIDVYANSNDEVLLSVVKSFNERKKNNRLPSTIDADHKIAKFVGDYYSENRFIL